MTYNSNSDKFDINKLFNLDKLSEEELVNLKNELSPYKKKGNEVEPTEFTNCSILNLRQKYMERLLITSMIGYMFRCAQEYENKDEALKFCNHIFRFDPTRHLESAKTNKVEVSDEEIGEIAKDLNIDDVREMAKEVYANANKIKFEASQASKLLNNADEQSVELAQNAVMRMNNNINESMAKIGKIANPRRSGDVSSLDGLIVPGEIFHHFERFYSYNYEELRKITETIYPERSDIEFAIKIYGTFKSAKKAEEHRHSNQDSFDYDVLTIPNNGFTLLGDFVKNREALDYYNKHSGVLQQIMDKALQDQHEGESLLKDRVQRDKKRDLEKHGMEPAKLKEWKELKGTIESFENKNPFEWSDEDKRKIAETREKLELLETDDDNNLVPIHRQKKDGDLETVYTQTKTTDSNYAHMH